MPVVWAHTQTGKTEVPSEGHGHPDVAGSSPVLRTIRILKQISGKNLTGPLRRLGGYNRTITISSQAYPQERNYEDEYDNREVNNQVSG